MRDKLEVALDWLERIAAIICVVAPATRKVTELLEPNKAE